MVKCRNMAYFLILKKMFSKPLKLSIFYEPILHTLAFPNYPLIDAIINVNTIVQIIKQNQCDPNVKIQS